MRKCAHDRQGLILQTKRTGYIFLIQRANYVHTQKIAIITGTVYKNVTQRIRNHPCGESVVAFCEGSGEGLIFFSVFQWCVCR